MIKTLLLYEANQCMNFQMAILEPKLAILDETDSGLDIDALRIVANGVNKLHSKNNAFVVITHYKCIVRSYCS